jgi:uncharacterized membrane protein
MTLGIPLLICILGLIIYFLPQDKSPKATEVGRLMFFAGLLIAVANAAAEVVRLVQ